MASALAAAATLAGAALAAAQDRRQAVDDEPSPLAATVFEVAARRSESGVEARTLLDASAEGPWPPGTLLELRFALEAPVPLGRLRTWKLVADADGRAQGVFVLDEEGLPLLPVRHVATLELVVADQPPEVRFELERRGLIERRVGGIDPTGRERARRAVARRILGSLPERQQVPELARRLRDLHAAARELRALVEAALAAAREGAPERPDWPLAREALETRLDRFDARLRALGEHLLEPATSVPSLRATSASAREALRALGAGADALRALATARGAASEAQEACERVLRALGLGAPSAPPSTEAAAGAPRVDGDAAGAERPRPPPGERGWTGGLAYELPPGYRLAGGTAGEQVWVRAATPGAGPARALVVGQVDLGATGEAEARARLLALYPGATPRAVVLPGGRFLLVDTTHGQGARARLAATTGPGELLWFRIGPVPPEAFDEVAGDLDRVLGSARRGRPGAPGGHGAPPPGPLEPELRALLDALPDFSQLTRRDAPLRLGTGGATAAPRGPHGLVPATPRSRDATDRDPDDDGALFLAAAGGAALVALLLLAAQASRRRR